MKKNTEYWKTRCKLSEKVIEQGGIRGGEAFTTWEGFVKHTSPTQWINVTNVPKLPHIPATTQNRRQ